MSLPIVILYGHKVELEELGWTAEVCQRCKKVQPFSVYDQIRTDHVYFIEVSSKEIGKIYTCDFCETSFVLPKGTAVKTDFGWRREQGLQPLVDRTNPQLGQLMPMSLPTPMELEALLLSINERSNVYNKDVTKGLIAGGFIGAVGLGLFGCLIKLCGLGFLGLDMFGYVFLFVLIGFGIGAVVGALRDSRNKARQAVYDLLENSMQKHDITVHSLRQAIQRSRQDFSRVEMALNTFYGEAASTPFASHTPNVSTAGIAYQSTAINQSGNVVCSQCKLTNFSYNANCRRCGTALHSPM